MLEKNRTMLVTGGAGFIGSNFVRLALERTSGRVAVLDKLTYAGSLENLREVQGDPRFRFEHGDIADRARVREVFRTQRPTSVVNFAAMPRREKSWWKTIVRWEFGSRKEPSTGQTWWFQRQTVTAPSTSCLKDST